MNDIDTMPGHLIRRLQQIAVAVFHLEAGAAGCDLTPVQFAALSRIAAQPGLDQATLAGLIAYDRTTIGGVVDRLIHKGLAERDVSARDRRARVLHVTPEGEAVLAHVGPAVERAQERMLAGLDAAERDMFLALLAKAIEAANDLSRAPMRGGDAG